LPTLRRARSQFANRVPQNFTYTIDNGVAARWATYNRAGHNRKRPIPLRHHRLCRKRRQQLLQRSGRAGDKRFTHGLQALASYTWSHEIDDGQSYGESTNNLWLSGRSYWAEQRQLQGRQGQRHARPAPPLCAFLGLGAHRHAPHRRLLQVCGERLAAFVHHYDADGLALWQLDCLPERHTGHGMVSPITA